MKIDPVVFLIGPDLFQRRLYVEELRDQLNQAGGPSVNEETFDASERNVAELIDSANTLPLLSERKLIIVRNAGNPKDADQDAWLRYLENPSPDTTLVVTVDKVDKRIRLFKTLAKKKAIVPLDPPKPRELSGWIVRLARRHKVTVSPRTAELLAEAVENDLGRLDQELEKLALYVHPETKITEPAVEALVLKTTGENVFAWTDRIVEGNRAGALTALAHLMESGEPPLVLVAMLARHLRILLKASFHAQIGTPTARMAPLLGVPPFVVGRYVEQARRLRPTDLRRSFSAVQTLDRDLKSTGLPPRLLLEGATRLMGRPSSVAGRSSVRPRS